LKIKELHVSFYRLTVRNDPPVRFEEILRRFTDQIPEDERRVWEAKEEPVRLQRLRDHTGYWLGDMMRIRIHEQINRGRRDGTIRPIDFEVGEGPCENTAFLYHPPTRTLVVHEQRGAVPLSALRQYFKLFGEVQGIEAAPLIKPEAIERAEHMHSVRAFEVHFAGIRAGHHLGGTNRSAGAILNLINHFGAPKAFIRVEVPRPRGRQQPGSLRNVINALHGLLPGRAAAEEIQKIVVVGRDAGGEADEEIINLLNDRLIERIQVNLNDDERITEERRLNAVVTAWNTHREYVQTISVGD
jgi:hypothetical protein